MAKYTFSLRFYIGAIFIITSLIVGKITSVLFFLHFNDPTSRYVSLVGYLLSWPLLFWGIWWVGKEYGDAVRRYVSYQFYHQSFKAGTRKAVEKTKQFHNHVEKKIGKFKQQVKERKESKKAQKRVEKNNSKQQL